MPPHRLHLGCGNVRLEKWINIDADTKLTSADVHWDLRCGIPFADGSCEFIYCEHFLEHLHPHEGVVFLRECHRALRTNGILRVAMPSLENIVKKYCQEDWRDQDWLKRPEYLHIRTRAEMLNIAFRWWGHQWLYDREELHRRLQDVGFQRIVDEEWGKSCQEGLTSLESRKDSLLICEATK